MSDNVNTENDHVGQMQPPPCRQYKRISSQQWEEQKDRIRAFYIEQEKPMAEVVEIMKELHGFEAG
jgi:Clr5 domain